MNQPKKRLNVAVTADTIAALDNLMTREGVTLTEAVRRLIGYGDCIYQHAKVQRGRVLLLDRDSETTREVTLL
ncbi:hypothetical protein ABZ215_33480 [Amycolatopsis sp. NPDC006131]|uniref:hypothetical protein n=1 Tax=Amycolatopsis sp. NPDC006131 TaxID=3156731 RepID=UPI0033A738C1